MKEELLSRAECNALRGLAIAGIFLHNYAHWLGPIVKENEYQFFQRNVDWFNQVLIHPDANLLLHLLSFFGHYGVPVFLFLSAYGLVKKYERVIPSMPVAHEDASARERGAGTFCFLRYHFLKLFKMMIVGFVAFTMVDAITPGRWHYDVLKIVAQLGMFNNLLPTPDRQIWPGPYWFFGLMLQLYIVYRLLLYRRHWGVTVALMVLCVVLQLSLSPESEALNRYRYNFMGGMLPFGMGLLAARYERYVLSWRGPGSQVQWDACLFVVSLVLVYLMSLGFVTWTFVPVMVCASCIGLVKLLTDAASSRFVRSCSWGLEWLGSISAALFVCHPITRKIFIPISRQGDTYTGLLLYVIASLCLAWVFMQLMKRIPNPSMK